MPYPGYASIFNLTDSVTQRVSGNNFSSTSNVSSAVERARSMLQRRRSTGSCSRLSQRERLRAASPSTVPSSTRGKKQKTTPEQPKPFEFAVMYVEDEDEEENLSIGFIHGSRHFCFYIIMQIRHVIS